jgi:Family of unknown function (DUF6011)
MNETTRGTVGFEWPWQGEIVEVDADRRTWRYYRCAVCRQPLTDPASVKRGYGLSCRRRLGDDECVRRREAIRAEDRRRFANRLDVERIVSRRESP